MVEALSFHLPQEANNKKGGQIIIRPPFFSGSYSSSATDAVITVLSNERARQWLEAGIPGAAVPRSQTAAIYFRPRIGLLVQR